MTNRPVDNYLSGMPGTDAVLRGLLVVVFAVSGTAKLRNPVVAAIALTQFRVVRRVRPVLGLLVGLLELGVAAGLVLRAIAPAALFAAVLLLSLFVVLIARALGRQERFSCACFGEREALGSLTLLRTGVLLVVGLAAALRAAQVGLDASQPLLAYGVAVGTLLFCISALALSIRRTRPFSSRL